MKRTIALVSMALVLTMTAFAQTPQLKSIKAACGACCGESCNPACCQNGCGDCCK